MKKNILIIGLFLTCFASFANEKPKYKAVNNSCIFDTELTNPLKNGEFKKGDLLILENNWAFLFDENIKANLEKSFVSGDILVDSIVPIKTKSLFEEKDIKYVKNDDFIYVPEYYYEILQKKDRALLPFKYEKHIQKISEYNDYTINSWYEPFALWNYLKITNALIGIGYGNGSSPNAIYDLNVINIDRISDGYEVIVANGEASNESLKDRYFEKLGGWLDKKLPKYTDFTAYKLIIKFDGDYVSLYVDNLNNLIQTFVKIDTTTKEAIEKLITNNSLDLSKVTWPRHADGSCDYDGSKKTAGVTQATKSSSSTNVALNKTMTVKENLKLRSGEATSTQVLTVMSAGTKVKILELGKAETIDGISSNWVKVEVQSGAKDRDGKPIKAGTVGWCYGGYLE